MSQEMLLVLIGGPGMVGLIIAVLGFFQNRRTLNATQPKTDAERMSIEINSLRSLLEETREVRKADKQDFDYRIAEANAKCEEQGKRYEAKIRDLYSKFAAYLEEHSIPKPRWWPRHHGGKSKAPDSPE